jgi:DNA-binding response OmpR family regulator
MKILILDDEENVLKSLERTLVLMKHEVKCFMSAKEAIPEIEGGSYDFALVDYKMPEFSGIWFMQNAKVPRATKVLLITAYVNREVITEMMKLGARGYLIKPFNENELKMHLSFHSTSHVPTGII